MIPSPKLGRSGPPSFRVAVDRPLPGKLKYFRSKTDASLAATESTLSQSHFAIDGLAPPLWEICVLTRPPLNDWVHSQSSATTSVFVAFKPEPPCLSAARYDSVHDMPIDWCR